MTTELLLSEVKDGLVRIAIAYTGDKYKKGNDTFTISEKDLHSISANMADRETPIDYEHMSASTVPPGWSKAAGWIAAKAGTIEDSEDGRKVLWGWFEPTPACLSSIRAKEYRYFSPEIWWDDKDEHGAPIGTRLRAGAITNRPFLKGLPPIEIDAKDFSTLLEAVALSESKRLMDTSAVHIDAAIKKEKKTVKKLTFKKLSEGENKGKIGVFDETAEMVGLCDKAAMKAYMAEDPDEPDADDAAEKKKAEMRETQTVCFSELAKATTSEAVVALTEKFVDEGKFDTKQLVRSQRIERLISGAIAKGTILPKQRSAMFSLAAADYESAVALLSEAKPVIDLVNRGIEGNGEPQGAAEEFDTKVTVLMSEKKMNRIDAFREVAAKNPALYERSKQRQPVASDRN